MKKAPIVRLPRTPLQLAQDDWVRRRAAARHRGQPFHEPSPRWGPIIEEQKDNESLGLECARILNLKKGLKDWRFVTALAELLREVDGDVEAVQRFRAAAIAFRESLPGGYIR